MTVCIRLRLILAVALLATASTTASAQVWQPFGSIDYTHDLQPFAPFEIRNFTDQPGTRDGYFFVMDKLSWAVPGERTVIGSPTATALAMDIFRGTPNPRPQIINGLANVSPDAQFRWGERYEFGYIVGHHGWEVGVLNGPKTNQQETYGFDDTNIVSHNSVASVAILFDFPPGLMDGFIDIFLPVDGNTDDINGDGVVTFDDLVTYLTTFDQVTVQNYTELDGVELMKKYRFKPTQRGSIIELSYGARYLRLRDHFRVDTIGGTIGDSFWDTVVANHIVGPQVGLKWYHQRGRWTINTQGRFTFGYNVQNHDQTGFIGENLAPGFQDLPIFYNRTTFTHGKKEQDFSPLVEMRVEASYHLTKAVALKLGWTGTFIDNIRRASAQVNYTLPNMGFVDNGTQDIFVSGVNVGVEINH